MSSLLDDVHGVEVEAILGSVLHELGPVDLLAQHVVLLVLVQVVVYHGHLAINLPSVLNELVGLKSQMLRARCSQGNRLVIVLDDVVDLGTSKEDIWADSSLDTSDALIIILSVSPCFSAWETSSFPIFSPGVIGNIRLVGVNAQTIACFSVFNPKGTIVTLNLVELTSAEGLVDLSDDHVRLLLVDLGLSPNVIENLFLFLVLTSFHIDQRYVLGVDFLKSIFETFQC